MAWRADLRERSVEGRGYRDPGRRSWLDRLLWSDPLRQARSRQSIHTETRGHAAPCNLCAQLIRYLSAWSDIGPPTQRGEERVMVLKSLLAALILMVVVGCGPTVSPPTAPPQREASAV